jgi:hypothetical protein
LAETQELIGGFWMIQVKSKPEAVEWAQPAHVPHGPDTDGPEHHDEFEESFMRVNPYLQCNSAGGTTP